VVRILRNLAAGAPMSIPDKDLDPDDWAECPEHGKPQPCPYCRFERQMQRAEELYEERESQP